MVTDKGVNSKTKDRNTTNLEYSSSILEDDVKDCELTKVHQRLHQKLNELSVLARNCQSKY